MKKDREFLESEYIKCMTDYEYFKNNYIILHKPDERTSKILQTKSCNCSFSKF